jgi:hypothetical protein
MGGTLIRLVDQGHDDEGPMTGGRLLPDPVPGGRQLIRLADADGFRSIRRWKRYWRDDDSHFRRHQHFLRANQHRRSADRQCLHDERTVGDGGCVCTFGRHKDDGGIHGPTVEVHLAQGGPGR